MPRISKKEMAQHLAGLPGWKFQNNAISKRFDFGNFVQSMAFANQVAAEAEGMNHHPDLLVQYGKVTVTLTSHDEGGVTDRDVALARKIEAART